MFNIVETPLERRDQLAELPRMAASEKNIRQRVLDAHRTLMSLNEANQEAFQDLVAALESDELEPPQRKAS